MRFLVALAAILFGILVWTLPAKSQEGSCFNVTQSIQQLDQYTKKQNLKARAYLWQSKHPTIELMIVWFNNVPDAVFVSAFRNGCLVALPDGQTGRVLKIDMDIIHAVNESEMLFENGGDSPFTSY